MAHRGRPRRTTVTVTEPTGQTATVDLGNEHLDSYREAPLVGAVRIDKPFTVDPPTGRTLPGRAGDWLVRDEDGGVRLYSSAASRDAGSTYPEFERAFQPAGGDPAP